MQDDWKMEKLIVLEMLLAALIIGSIFVPAWPMYRFDNVVNEITGVTMQTVEGSSSATGVTILAVNHTDKVWEYGAPYDLQKLINGNWYTMSHVIPRVAFTAEERFLDPGEYVWRFEWKRSYGRMEPGAYRLVKIFRLPQEKIWGWVAAEFTI